MKLEDISIIFTLEKAVTRIFKGPDGYYICVMGVGDEYTMYSLCRNGRRSWWFRNDDQEYHYLRSLLRGKDSV